MQRVIIFFLITMPICAVGQWRDIGRGKLDGSNLAVYPAIGVHNHEVFLAFKDVGVIKYTPSGWIHADTGIDGSQGLVTLFTSLDQHLFASITDPRVAGAFVTSDDGSRWTALQAGSPIGLIGALLFGSRISLYGNHPYYIVRSRDSGRTWDSITNLNVYHYATGASVLLAGVSNDVWRSRDSGNTWALMPQYPHGLNLKSFAAVGSSLYAGGSGVFRSTDSGYSWNQLALFDKSVFSLASSKGFLFAGTDSGVYVSLDTGITWRNVSEGMKGWKGYIPHVLLLAVADSMLYATVQSSDLVSPTDYRGYATARPIREMVDTTQSKVVTAPPQVADAILVHPNPSRGVFTIEAPSAELRSVSVLNLLGQEVVHSAAGMPPSTRVDLSAVASGTYFLRIDTGSGTVMKKIVRE